MGFLARRRRGGQPTEGVLRKVPDDLPRTTMFTEPIRVDRITVREPEATSDGQIRVAFVVFVRDAADARCPDLAVEAAIEGPTRRAEGMATTDLLGRTTFRMTGPAGRYRLTVLDVAAGALGFDRSASVLEASTDAEG